MWREGEACGGGKEGIDSEQVETGMEEKNKTKQKKK
jgi:hypothetical protein